MTFLLFWSTLCLLIIKNKWQSVKRISKVAWVFQCLFLDYTKCPLKKLKGHFTWVSQFLRELAFTTGHVYPSFENNQIKRPTKRKKYYLYFRFLFRKTNKRIFLAEISCSCLIWSVSNIRFYMLICLYVNYISIISLFSLIIFQSCIAILPFSEMFT